MISIIGSFITQFDAAIQGAMTQAIIGLIAYIATPVMTTLALYYVILGVQVVRGDAEPMAFVRSLVKNILILKFCSNAALYNQWVTDFFYVGLTTALGKAVLHNATDPASLANGSQGAGAAFNLANAQLGQLVSMVFKQADFWDVSSRAAALGSYLFGGLMLVIIAMVYLMSRFLLAIVIVLGVLAVACLIHDLTKPIFERWLGKVIALVFLQVTAIVVVDIVLTMNQAFLKQIMAAHVTSADGVLSLVQALISVDVLFVMGAFAVYSLPAIAYSIGTGVSVSTNAPPMLAAAALGRGLGTLSMPTASAPAAAAEAGGGLSLGLAQTELTGSAVAAIRAPDPKFLPPPPLSLPGF